MVQIHSIAERRTNADVVFDHLYDEIVSLRLLPGTKISEVEIARQFGVSRQPVRDAFSRLDSLGFLLIRPQKATEIKRFSLKAIATARFIRTAIEIEVLHKAGRLWQPGGEQRFAANLAAQREAVSTGDADGFHALDHEFHRLLCEAAEAPFAFEAIAANRAEADRLCVLSLMQTDSMGLLLADHTAIIGALARGDDLAAAAVMRGHLQRLDATINTVRNLHGEYFER
ncbi:MAG: GntR family transcriptional regulator [Tabrizicola sp.]|nr:GntR family transcriptional regulator [Tabrizicola sp.]